MFGSDSFPLGCPAALAHLLVEIEPGDTGKTSGTRG